MFLVIRVEIAEPIFMRFSLKYSYIGNGAGNTSEDVSTYCLDRYVITIFSIKYEKK